MNINRICILGHSGIGKSSLAESFAVGGWEPFRVRVPRDERDAEVCKSPEEFAKLVAEFRSQTPIYQSEQMKVYDQWSFFSVRGKDQCLFHTEQAKSPHTILRVETFAPLLVEMLANHQRLSTAFSLDPARTLVILLNPTSTSFREMAAPSPELLISTSFAVAERYRVGNKSVDLADVIQRAEHLGSELVAWRELFNTGAVIVECRNWEHFEYRYKGSANAANELNRARLTLWKAINKQSRLDERGMMALRGAIPESPA